MIKKDIFSTQQANIKNHKEDISLQRIPDNIYQNMIETFSEQYHFKNGERMRISNYFVAISRSLSDKFVLFIQETIKNLYQNQFPDMPTPYGFKPHPQNLLDVELNGGFSLGSFDMAVTNNGLQNIEFQSLATYPISAAKLSQYLLDNMELENAYIFADQPETNWNDFINIYNNIIGGEQKEGIVLIDKNIDKQKTNFEFFATQKELDIPVEIVDLKDVFEKEEKLFYTTPNNKSPRRVTRLYNRILLAEALFDDDYPNNEMWKFRFDKKYKSLKFINHPIKQFEVSKRLSPYINHSFNPTCYELSKTAKQFLDGTLKYNDFVWKHKWGAAGHRLILSPNEKILKDLSKYSQDYIAQKKVLF